ncbi:uncharacterized protein V6R79_004144 [Siganus canaliculatus]
MSSLDPLCKSPLECNRVHIAFTEIWIDCCGLQGGLAQLLNKANRLQAEIPQVQRNCPKRGTKMADRCYVHRGGENDNGRHGDTRPPRPSPAFAIRVTLGGGDNRPSQFSRGAMKSCSSYPAQRSENDIPNIPPPF